MYVSAPISLAALAAAGASALAQPVELKPGGYHLMLMDLKQPIAKDTTVPLTLQFQDAQGAKSTLSLNAPVRSAAPAGAAPAHMHKH